eukprot:CAMPEP_0174316902 /NCGR_PEP_ID=MMETSP0810-20121108/7263_1 /TAXON_ID=73025 ORGANISM="Eutreptiella gymnastica-like, Strain CCMP1594" /NCGR_SAMPLE_ID=MMETSP0810 /ASSEMBLY_ACC=CAM_ASM_000659 /LENGTH=100 /DNA_ID=CAMNT_0015426777 /DNA_START=256 /DNA_END=559 /DNA_ORIENTATION=-
MTRGTDRQSDAGDKGAGGRKVGHRQPSTLTATELTHSPNQDFGVQKIFPVVKIRSPHSPTEQWEFCRSLTLTAMAASADACTWVSAEPPPPDNPRVRHEA